MNTQKTVLTGLMVALVCICTMVIQIPIAGTGGYVNIGDSMIFISSIFLGPINGMIAGGIGSAMADVFSGYSQWALFTLFIKGFEGFIVGMIMKNSFSIMKAFIATFVGTCTMVVGYLFAGVILYGSFAASITSVPSNFIQGIICMIISILFSYVLVQNKAIKNLVK